MIISIALFPLNKNNKQRINDLHASPIQKENQKDETNENSDKSQFPPIHQRGKMIRQSILRGNSQEGFLPIGCNL